MPSSISSLRRVRGLLVLGALGAGATPGAAQREPRRPNLGPMVDTNSAVAYHQYAITNIARQPARAADAFYWAARLEPDAPRAFYGRYVAMLLQNRDWAVRYAVGDESFLRSRDIRAIDSLALRAYLRDPFTPRQLFSHITQEALYQITGVAVASMDVRYPEWNARVAAERGDYADAASWLARAIQKYPRAYMLHDDRADAFFMLRQYDSAATELGLVLAAQRQREARRLVYAYESKAFTEFKTGWALAHKGDIAGAREAYGRALTEDISFWRAHEALADVALAQHDTATALQELDLAAQIATTSPVVQEKYGILLETTGRLDDAAAALRRAIAAEPYYASPYFYLGRVLAAQGKAADAATQYRAFVARAAQGDPRMEAARGEATRLAGSGDR